MNRIMESKRIVIKVGTSTLTHPSGKINIRHVENLCKVIADLPLPVAGLMSDAPLEEVNDLLEQAKAAAHRMGVSPGIDPFMTLSFMSLPVIPALKITTHGVFDVEQWKYI